MAIVLLKEENQIFNNVALCYDKKKSEFKAKLFTISFIILKNNTFFHDNILSNLNSLIFLITAHSYISISVYRVLDYEITKH